VRAGEVLLEAGAAADGAGGPPPPPLLQDRFKIERGKGKASALDHHHNPHLSLRELYLLCQITPLRSYLYGGLYGGLYERAHIIRYFPSPWQLLNFSIAYGKTAFGLAADWGVSKEEAQATVDAWYEGRPGVKAWQERTVGWAERDGFVSTLLGRQRVVLSLSDHASALLFIWRFVWGVV
jgi:hypothetical protein